MIQRDRADGFEIAGEDGVDDRGANTLCRKAGKMRADGVRPARDHGEIDEADFGLALARQHPHQIESCIGLSG